MRRRTNVAVALACLAGGLAACGDHEVVFPDPGFPLISVAGYVLIDLDPAYGVVVLVDETGTAVGSDVILGGKYSINRQIEAGTVVCNGWAVRAFLEDDFGPREARIELADSLGSCVAPEQGRVLQWIQFELTARQRDGS